MLCTVKDICHTFEKKAFCQIMSSTNLELDYLINVLI